MKKDVDLKEYFKEHLPSTEYNSQFIRVTNALVRNGTTTMDALCGKSDEQLMRVRNLGAKCFEAAVLMRKMYLAEIEKEKAASQANP